MRKIDLVKMDTHGAWVIYGVIGVRTYCGDTICEAMRRYKQECNERIKTGGAPMNRIFSTDIWDNYQDLEEIKDTISECDFFSRPVSEISDDEAYQWANDEVDRNTDDLMAHIRTADREHPSMWVIAARIGRWNGTFDGGKVFRTLEDAVRAAWEDMDDFEIREEDDGETVMIGRHHDGSNTYHLRRINERGKAFYEDNCFPERRQLVERLMNPDFSDPASLPNLFGWR